MEKGLKAAFFPQARSGLGRLSGDELLKILWKGSIMKSKYKNRILLVGITVGSVFFHHEPGKKPCAEFYFQPLKKKYCEKERMILRCKAYDEAAYTVKNSYHG